MMIFTEALFHEDPIFAVKDGKPYGTDSRGREYEITPDLVNKYYDMNGGKWKLMAKPMLGAMAGGFTGGAAGPALAYGLNRVINPDHSLSQDEIQIPGIIGGASLGLAGAIHGWNNETHRALNDIVRLRRSGKI